ncbi:hypothetical protein KM043_002890 [Ampulex compressa]|nr:hypothetical protein KM043_002890 [Ampulex compressa]
MRGEQAVQGLPNRKGIMTELPAWYSKGYGEKILCVRRFSNLLVVHILELLGSTELLPLRNAVESSERKNTSNVPPLFAVGDKRGLFLETRSRRSLFPTSIRIYVPAVLA